MSSLTKGAKEPTKRRLISVLNIEVTEPSSLSHNSSGFKDGLMITKTINI